MLPPPTTIATSTPSDWTRATCEAMKPQVPGSMPYERDPMRASPDSFSRMR